MINFDWDKFKTEKIAVHCDTEDKAKKFLKECDQHGIRWGDGKNILGDTYWNDYGSETCYSCIYGFGYSPTSFYKNENCTIINYEEEITMTNKLQELENKQREIADEIKKLREQKETENLWCGIKKYEPYFLIDLGDGEVKVDSNTFDPLSHYDEKYINSGFAFSTEQEAQRMADMIRYVGLLSRKAREMSGLLGYGRDVNANFNPYTLFWGNIELNLCKAIQWTEQPPLQPILTKECAEKLVKDPEIIEAARKAWGVK